MKDWPATIKRSIEMVGLFTAGAVIVLGRKVIMPLLMAFFFSVLLMPVFRFFRKYKVPELIAIFLSILVLTIVTGLILWLFISQVTVLVNDFPLIQQNINLHLNHLSVWINKSFGYSPKQQIQFINTQSNKLFSAIDSIFKSAVGSITDIVVFFGLLPVYIFLIMLYRNLFLEFTLMWFAEREYENVELGIRQTENMIKKYLFGLFIQITYIIVLLGGSLMLFGIKNALLIGILFAFLNLIPYLGAFIGNILGVLITLAASQNLIDIFIVLGAISVVQFLDNNILMPRIVGSQVKINPLVSIVSIIAGGAMAGIAGMFLAMPVISILKIVFDRSKNFKHWGVLLGDNRPSKSPMNI